MKQLLQENQPGLWSFRDMRLVLPARALSFAGDSIAMVALMLRVSEHGGPAAMTALLLAFAVPTVLMIPVAGRIVDGYDSRTVLVVSELVQVAAVAGIAFSSGLATTVVLVCVLQLGQAVSGPAWGALVPRIVGDELAGRAIGVGQALIGVAMLAGSAAGGLLVGWRGDRVALLVDAATFAGLAVAAAMVRTRRRPRAHAERGGSSAAAGLSVLFGDRLLRILLPGLWVFILAGEAVNVVEVFLVTDAVGLGPGGYGMVLAFQGGGGVAGAWLASRLAADCARARAVLRGTIGIGLACIAMGLARGAVPLVVAATACGLAGGLLNAANGALVVTRSPEARRGSVLAALTGTSRACGVVALVLGGIAGAWLGPRVTFVVAGVVCVLTGLTVTALLGRSLRVGADAVRVAAATASAPIGRQGTVGVDNDS